MLSPCILTILKGPYTVFLTPEHYFQHVTSQYDEMMPILEALLKAYPTIVSEEQICYETYMWAVNLWYAYAMEVGTQRHRAAHMSGVQTLMLFVSVYCFCPAHYHHEYAKRCYVNYLSEICSPDCPDIFKGCQSY